jgi:hypothetical protein
MKMKRAFQRKWREEGGGKEREGSWPVLSLLLLLGGESCGSAGDFFVASGGREFITNARGRTVCR